ncbi:MAG: hypothetical protein WCL30_04455 [Pseudomonadota bacterium]
MGIDLNQITANVSSYRQPIVQNSSGEADFSPKISTADVAPVKQNNIVTDKEVQYEAAIREASLSFKNTYAVSDTTFTIFKDSTGQFITRYISLRDGKVTYVPEPVLLKHIQSANNSSVGFSIKV